MKFKIEQIALYPASLTRAMRLLKAIGLEEWSLDHVVAQGRVFGMPRENEADLAFNYQAAGDKPLELEILRYTKGDNWMAHRPSHDVSHIGMHVTAAELVAWRALLASEGIVVAQEVITQSHINPVIKDSRRYNYVIFDTFSLLGVDLKFIVRIDLPKA